MLWGLLGKKTSKAPTGSLRFSCPLLGCNISYTCDVSTKHQPICFEWKSDRCYHFSKWHNENAYSATLLRVSDPITVGWARDDTRALTAKVRWGPGWTRAQGSKPYSPRLTSSPVLRSDVELMATALLHLSLRHTWWYLEQTTAFSIS